MLKKTDIITFLRTNRHLLKAKYNISSIALFGSFARDEQTKDSDVDLLVEFEPNTSNIFDNKIQLKAFLGSHFNRDVDLCREKYIKPYARNYLEKEIIYV